MHLSSRHRRRHRSQGWMDLRFSKQKGLFTMAFLSRQNAGDFADRCLQRLVSSMQIGQCNENSSHFITIKQLLQFFAIDIGNYRWMI